MEFLRKITDAISSLDERETKNYAYMAWILVFLTLSFGVYKYYSKTSYIKAQIEDVNSKRKEIQILLSQFDQTKKQKSKIEDLIKQDKKFRIKQYFGDTIKKLDIEHLVTKDPDIKDNELKESYTEITLTAKVTRANTKQLAQLLNEIEQEKRIYVKKLDINKGRHSKTLNFVIVIATLQFPADNSETTG
ncbi:hypothetical protein HN446_02585 [bacterium]|jgi:hypothetical protein|nr:hypothetical protein [bacterium]